MAKSVIQLLSTHFDLIEVRPEQSASDIEKIETIFPEVKIDVGRLSTAEDGRKWSYSLSVKISPAEDQFYPYHGKFVISGEFVVHPTIVEAKEEAEIARLIAVNGGSILYGAVREMFTLLTGRGPYGSIPPIPAMDLRDFEVEVDSDDENTLAANRVARVTDTALPKEVGSEELEQKLQKAKGQT